MATNKVKGNSGSVLVSTNAVAEVTSFEFTVTPVIMQGVAQGDTWAEADAGSKSWAGTIEAYYDASDTTGQGALTAGSSVALKLYPEGNTAGKKEYSGTAIIGAVPIRTPVDDWITITFPFTGDGALAESTVSA